VDRVHKKAAVDPAPVVVAYIGGIGRSGSTLLCRALDRLPGTVHVGEICYLWNQSVRNNRLCSCGAAFRSCPFWTAVGERAFGGWDHAPAERADQLRRRIERNRNIARMLGSRPSRFRRELDEYADLMDRVFVAIRDESGARVVVDNSKLPSSAYLRHRQPRVDLRLVHLVRSSHGVAHSWAKDVRREDFDGRAMGTFSPVKSAMEWTAYNLALDALALRGVPGVVVRYENLVARPQEELTRIARLLDVELSADDLGFLGEGTIDLALDHSVWGNPMRVRTGPQPLCVDDAWRSSMPPRTRATVTALSLPGLLRYGYLDRGPTGADAAAHPQPRSGARG